jgi:hypothetical protein
VPQEKGEIAVIIGESDPKHRTAFVPSARSRYAVADLQRVFVFFWVGGGGGVGLVRRTAWIVSAISSFEEFINSIFGCLNWRTERS